MRAPHQDYNARARRYFTIRRTLPIFNYIFTLNMIKTTPIKVVKSAARAIHQSAKVSQAYHVIVYDKPGVDRTAVRAQHMNDIPAKVNSGEIKAAGPIFSDESRTKFAGSFFFLDVADRAVVLEFLKKDIYATAGIWDLNNVSIFPMVNAVSLPQRMGGVDEKLFT